MKTREELLREIESLEAEVDNLRDEYYGVQEYLKSLYDDLDNGYYDEE